MRKNWFGSQIFLGAAVSLIGACGMPSAPESPGAADQQRRAGDASRHAGDAPRRRAGSRRWLVCMPTRLRRWAAK